VSLLPCSLTTTSTKHLCCAAACLLCVYVPGNEDGKHSVLHRLPALQNSGV
jgi:hypothetical protein